jgi:microcompartment protein CcmL/EutN
MTAKERGTGRRAEGWAPYAVAYPGDTVTLGSLELTSIALGFSAADAMVKAAGVEMIDARAVCPGKFFILVCGTVADTEEAVAAGTELAGKSLTGSFLIPNLSPSVLPAVNRYAGRRESPLESPAVGVVETFSAASAIYAADASVKGAEAALESINLLNGLGGKSYYLLVGEITDVEAGLESGCAAVDERDIVHTVIIPRVDPAILPFFPGGMEWT